jgi:hypothetical protein
MSAGTCCMATSVADTAPSWADGGDSETAPWTVASSRTGRIVFTGVSDWAKLRLMKENISSAGGIHWPIIPKWEDRQICLIPCWVWSDKK